MIASGACHASWRRTRGTAKSGYILPITLIVLALAAVVLARVCRQTMRESLAVAEESRDLQRKWSLLSCQSTLLANVDVLLAQAAGSNKMPAVSRRAELTLGGQTVQLLMADEQAKVNVNTLFHLRDRQETERYVSTALRAGGINAPVRLRPWHRPGERSDSKAIPVLFSSFGGLFSEPGPFVSVRSLMSATREITCWGNGRLNYRQATRAQIGALAANHPDVMKRILARQSAPASLAMSLDPLNLPAINGKALDDVFTDTSTCFSLWIVATDGDCTEARFGVHELGEDGQFHVTCLSW